MEEKCLNDRSPIISTRIIDPIAEDFSRLRRLDDDKFKQELGEIKEKMNLAQIYDLLRQRKKGN